MLELGNNDVLNLSFTAVVDTTSLSNVRVLDLSHTRVVDIAHLTNEHVLNISYCDNVKATGVATLKLVHVVK